MIVYEVYFSSCRFEGGGTEAVYSTIEAARAHALARVREREQYRRLSNLQWARNNQDHTDDDEWVEEDPNVWGNGMGVVVIQARDVDDPKPMQDIVDMMTRHDEAEEENKEAHAAWARGDKDAFVRCYSNKGTDE